LNKRQRYAGELPGFRRRVANAPTGYFSCLLRGSIVPPLLRGAPLPRLQWGLGKPMISCSTLEAYAENSER
jgi:hypothetical protein